MKKMHKVLHSPMILSILLFGLAGMAATPNSRAKATSLADQVRHKIIMLPYYGVFDTISYQIKDQNTVILTGQVTLAFLKDDATEAVRSIEGAGKIINDIEILPLSRYDDSIRLKTYWAIYSQPGFERYAIRADQPVKIIVKNGHVTLDGFVHNELEKTMALQAANSVPNVFRVTDNLKIG